MAAKGTNTTRKKNTSNVATQKANSATMAARYSTPAKNTSSSRSSIGKAVSNAVKTATSAATSAVKPTTSPSIGSSVSNAIKTATNSVTSNIPAGAGSSSTSSSVNKAVAPTPVKYVDTVKQEADRQKAANESYVNNLLTQLKKQGGVSGMLNANTNANMSPSQRTNSMLNVLSNLIPGTALATGISPTPTNNARTLLQTLANDTSNEDRQASTNINDMFSYQPTPTSQSAADIFANGYTMNDAQRREAQARLGLLGDTRPTNTTDAMMGDPRFIAPQRGNATLQDAVAQAARNTLVESVDNPNYNAPYIEVPSALAGRPAYDSLVNPLAVVSKDSLDNSTPNAMAGDPRFIAPADATALGESVSNAITNATGSAPNSLINALSNLGDGGSSSSSSTRSYSRSGSGSGSALGDGSIDISTLYDLLNQRLGEYDANFDEMMAALMDNYNMNFQSLEDAYAAALNRLGGNYADTEALLNSSLANSQRSLEDGRTRALQEAYIARMMQEKNLADQLDAYGLSGGATESVLADMRNNYNNNRNSIETKVQESLRELLQQYLSNLSDARGRYNDSLLSAETNLLNARQNLANQMSQAQNNAINTRSQQRAGAYEDLYNTLANLTMKGINYV